MTENQRWSHVLNMSKREMVASKAAMIHDELDKDGMAGTFDVAIALLHGAIDLGFDEDMRDATFAESVKVFVRLVEKLRIKNKK